MGMLKMEWLVGFMKKFRLVKGSKFEIGHVK